MNTDLNKFISDHLNRINWVFFDLSHPGNLGASARALKVMNASNIKLVNPVKAGLAMESVAIRRAAGAKDVLESCSETTFEQATKNSNYVIAFSARKREIEPQLLDFNTMVDLVVELLMTSQDSRVSMVFGGERVGLQNKDLIKCTHLCKFDVNPTYSSLNLSHAVQLVSYALRAKLKTQFSVSSEFKPKIIKNSYSNNSNFNKMGITQKKILELKKSFLELSTEIGLIQPDKKGKVEDKIIRILNSTNLSENDFKLLHSFFALVKKNLKEKQQ